MRLLRRIGDALNLKGVARLAMTNLGQMMNLCNW